MVFHPADPLYLATVFALQMVYYYIPRALGTKYNPSHYHSKSSDPYESLLFLRNLHQLTMAADPCNS